MRRHARAVIEELLEGPETTLMDSISHDRKSADNRANYLTRVAREMGVPNVTASCKYYEPTSAFIVRISK